MKVTVLGCGFSSGVPLIGCNCKTCTSDNPKNKRTRVSVFIEINGKNILIDTSPDLRQQALRHNISKIDAVLYTHDHADHTHGIDDLRAFNYLSDNSIVAFGDNSTLESIKQRFNYAFQTRPAHFWSRPSLTPVILPDSAVAPFVINDNIQALAFAQQHGKARTTGYRIDKFAYSTDVDNLPEESFKALEGIELWVVDCLRYAPSYSHSHLEQTLRWIARVKPKLAILTHMSHELEYEKLSKELPAGVVPGYDGMTVEL